MHQKMQVTSQIVVCPQRTEDLMSYGICEGSQSSLFCLALYCTKLIYNVLVFLATNCKKVKLALSSSQQIQ